LIDSNWKINIPVRIPAGDDERSVRTGGLLDQTMREQASIPRKQDHIPRLDLPQSTTDNEQDVAGADRRAHAVAGRAHLHVTEPAQHVREERMASGGDAGILGDGHVLLRSSS
jgi:hypothetical protein